MDRKLSLSNLYHIYSDSIKRDERTLAFEIANGRGRFLFLMFFDSNDYSTRDELFIFMRNTQRMLRLKMYGSHRKGEFDVFIKPFMESWFKDELQLNNNSRFPFVFESFFETLNTNIPLKLPLAEKIHALRESWIDIAPNLPKEIIQEADKIYLIGPKKSPHNQTPRERTLRKLYLFAEGEPSDIKELIRLLKRLNITLAWTANKNQKGDSVISILNSLK